MSNYSRQREAILNNLRGRKDHPTADMVYECVRKEYANISLGTVYRNLALLEEEGRILRLSTGYGSDHYDGCVEPHVHFVCRGCGSVMDLDYPPLENPMEKAKEGFRGNIESYELMFHGLCPDCLPKEND